MGSISRLAGKPAGYLFNQLVHFRDGRRHYGPMARLLEPLVDDYLQEIARHFAAQDLPYPPAPVLQAFPAHCASAGNNWLCAAMRCVRSPPVWPATVRH
jgi:cytochrome c553